MTTGEGAAIVTILGSFLAMLGITGIDTNMVSQAVQGFLSIVTVLAAMYSWWQHRKATKALTAATPSV